MTTATADAKRRIVLPGAKAGDVFDIQKHGEGHSTPVRLQRLESPVRKSRKDVLRAIAEAPLRPTMSWYELRQITREPWRYRQQRRSLTDKEASAVPLPEFFVSAF